MPHRPAPPGRKRPRRKSSGDAPARGNSREEQLALYQLSILDGASHAIVSASPDGAIATANAAAERLFGRSRDEMCGRPLEMLLPFWPRLPSGSGQPRAPVAAVELQARRNDGTEIPVEVTLRPIPPNKRAGSILFITDLSERKQAQEALLASSAQLSLAQEAAGIGMWDWNLESGQIRCTEQWSRLRGLPPHAIVLSVEQWLETIHPDDRERVRKGLSHAPEGGGPYEAEFRVVWPDGTVHWLLGKGGVFRDAADRPNRLLGCSLDITAHHTAEEALRSSEQQLQALTAGLYRAQEDERRRIARELHDDVSQRMAMLSNEIATVEKDLPALPAGLRQRVESFRAKLDQLSDDLRCVAYRLHSPVLEQFGLAAALESHCADFAGLYPVQVKFAKRNLPRKLPLEVASCLYRVAQECLHNVAKHSAATRASISLQADKRTLRLSICDNGKGFEPDVIEQRKGLGLVGIRERVRILGGRLSIDTGGERGACIEVELPLPGDDK